MSPTGDIYQLRRFAAECSLNRARRSHWGSGRPRVPYTGMRHLRAWSEVRGIAACKRPPRRFVVAVAAAVAALAVVSHCGLSRSVPQPPSPAQSVLSSWGGELTAHPGQPHLVDGLPICTASKVLVTAALPRSAAIALISLGGGLAAFIGAALLTQLVVPAGRSPPRAFLSFRTGQDLLTRFCLSRR